MVKKTTDKTKPSFKDEITAKIQEATSKDETQKYIHIIARLIEDYIQNDQWQEYNEQRGKAERIPIPRDTRKKKERVTANFIFPMWRTLKGLILQAEPEVRAEPENLEDVNDVLGSEMAQRMIQYMNKRLLNRKNRIKFVNTLFSYGNAILHPFINSDEELSQYVLPPTQIYPVPFDAHDWDQLIGIVWRREVPKIIMQRTYPDLNFSGQTIPEHLKKIRPQPHEVESDNILLDDYYELPGTTDKHPGYFARLCGSQYLEEDFLDEYPYEFNLLPFIRIRENDLSDGIFGFPSLKLVLGRQLDHNKAESLLAELRKCLPKLLVKYESKINPKEIIDTLSTVLEYIGEGGVPQWTSVPPVSPELIRSTTAIPASAEHTMGLHDLMMRASSIGSLQSNVALQTLQEQDLIRMYAMMENIKNGTEDLYTFGYKMIDQYYSPSMIRNILGEKGLMHYKAYKSIKLSPMTFTIEAESMWPKSKTVIQERTIQAAQYGGVDMTNPRERMEFLKVVTPEMAKNLNDYVRHERRARKENTLIIEGRKVAPDPFDDHKIHIDVINELILDPRFNDLPLKIQAAALAHRTVHHEEIQRKMKEIQQQFNQGGPNHPAPTTGAPPEGTPPGMAPLGNEVM